MKCRLCSSSVVEIIDFGQQPVANNFSKDKSNNFFSYNLKCVFCENCYLFQSTENPSPNEMFNKNYPFFTGISDYMTKHFNLFVEHALKFSEISNNSLVVEIGSNDGTMLNFLERKKIKHLGIDPSENVAQLARQNGHDVISDFFGLNCAKIILETRSKAKLVLAANVICHIPDLIDTFQGVELILEDEGVFIFEEPYVLDMIEKTSFDQIYDEHIYIFGLIAVKKLLDTVGLKLVHAERQTTHGGSMRYYVAKNKSIRNMSENLLRLLATENEFGLNSSQIYLNFASKTQEKKSDLVHLLNELKSNGARIGGYGATSKSTTVLNYCGVGPELINFISDSTKEKIGTFSPGVHIPIISHDEMRANQPDYLLLFAWNHKFEIFEFEKEKLRTDTKFISYVPSVVIENL